MRELMPIFESLRQRESLPCSYPLAMGPSRQTNTFWVNCHKQKFTIIIIIVYIKIIALKHLLLLFVFSTIFSTCYRRGITCSVAYLYYYIIRMSNNEKYIFCGKNTHEQNYHLCQSIHNKFFNNKPHTLSPQQFSIKCRCSPTLWAVPLGTVCVGRKTRHA